MRMPAGSKEQSFIVCHKASSLKYSFGSLIVSVSLLYKTAIQNAIKKERFKIETFLKRTCRHASRRSLFDLRRS